VVNALRPTAEHLLIAQSNLSKPSKPHTKMSGSSADQHEPADKSTDRHLRGPLALVVGSEGEGLHQLTRSKCDLLLRLPMKGRIESLNAAVAGSVALYLAHLARS
jgi:23S rRNA (guanosine2251-2'-O)-methyltransferase